SRWPLFPYTTLFRSVVDPCPALARVVGAEDATHSVDPGTGVHRRVVRARGGCPKAHAVAFVDVGDRFEGRTRVRGTPHAVVTVVLPAGQPDITGVAGYRGETDVALGRDHVGVGGLEGDTTVVTGVERAVGD